MGTTEQLRDTLAAACRDSAKEPSEERLDWRS